MGDRQGVVRHVQMGEAVRGTAEGRRPVVQRQVAAVARAAEVVRFILNPPFKGPGKYFYKIISNAAIATLDQHELTLLGLNKRSTMWLKLARVSLGLFLAILGPEAPAVLVAKERVARSN